MLLDLLHRVVHSWFQSLGFRTNDLESDVGWIHYLLWDQPQPADAHPRSSTGDILKRVVESPSLIKGNHRVAALDLPGEENS